MSEHLAPGMYVILSSGPGPVSQFVELEDEVGHGIGPEQSGAQWHQRPDGFWALGPFGVRYPPQTTEELLAGWDEQIAKVADL